MLRNLPLTSLLAASFALGACQKGAEDTAAVGAKSAAAEVPAEPRSQELADALASYEALRAQLAADKTEEIAAHAADLAKHARGAAASATDEARKAKLEALGTAAEAMARTEPRELAPYRAAYSEVSKPLVELMAAAPGLRKGLHVFTCPMVDGYAKWVQPSEKLENPHMGPRMLACGGPAKWE